MDDSLTPRPPGTRETCGRAGQTIAQHMKLKIAGVVAIIFGVLYLDARSKLNWKHNIQNYARSHELVVVPDTAQEINIDLFNPFLWGGYANDAILCHPHYEGSIDGPPGNEPTGVKLIYANVDGKDHAFWMIFSSDRKLSKSYSISALKPENPIQQVLALSEKGDEQFKPGEKDRFHDEVLNFITVQ